MASNLDIFLDAGGGGIVAGGSAPGGALPALTRNDVYNLRIALQDAPAGFPPIDLDTTGGTFRVAIGNIDDGPTSGQFKLILNGVTSSAITYSSDETTLAANIYAAVSNNVATPISQFGTEPDAFILTATGTNTALSFSSDSFTLFPTSSVLISTRRNQGANVSAQQILKLRRNPAVFSDTFTTASTAGAITLTKVQDGDSASSKNETYKIELSPLVAGGQFILNYGGNSTTGIPVGLLGSAVQQLLSSVTGIGNNNIAVSDLPNGKGYTIAFVRNLGNQNVSTALSLDASGVYFRPWRETALTMATAELDELFADEGTTSITPTIEIEYTENGNPKTLYQGTVTVKKDLIFTGSVVPAGVSGYYTKAESDALFVEDSTSGTAGSIDAANFKLASSDGTASINWNTRKLFDGGTEYIRWKGGLGFFNSAAVAKPTGSNLINSLSNLGLLSYSTPTQDNVISNLVSSGLFSSSSTYGVLPSSPKTLTTTASINFGSIGMHDTAFENITVTGCSVNDIVLIGLPNSVCYGLVYSGHVISTNTVCVAASNTDNQAVDSTAQTFRITVIGY